MCNGNSDNHLRGVVYVVDGDSAVRDSLRSLLGLLGLRVEDYDSAEAFLERAKITAPAVLVVEVNLPGTSGIELVERIRHRGIDLPSVVTSTQGDAQLAVRAKRAGALDFFEKPFVDRMLTDRIEEALASQA